MATVRVDDTLLGIYLNDHLAGATAGAELAERVAAENRDRADGRSSVDSRRRSPRTVRRCST